MSKMASIAYDNSLIPSIALYCSDGRFTEHYDAFLKDHCDMPVHNRIAVPGGAGCLAGAFAAYREGEAVLDLLGVLCEAHKVKRIVLIGHQGCAYYQMRLGVAEQALLGRIREDLQKASTKIRELRPGVEVERFLARVDDGSVVFNRV